MLMKYIPFGKFENTGFEKYESPPSIEYAKLDDGELIEFILIMPELSP